MALVAEHRRVIRNTKVQREECYWLVSALKSSDLSCT